MHLLQCRRAGERAAAVTERRLHRKEQQDLLDELLPKATGGTREARVRFGSGVRSEACAAGSAYIYDMTCM